MLDYSNAACGFERENDSHRDVILEFYSFNSLASNQ